MYAIVETGAKQYKVQVGSIIDVERMPVEKGRTVELSRVLLVSDAQVQVGAPILDGAKVVAKVVGHWKAPKVLIFKYKNKTRYARKIGHRQPFTRLAIQSIETEKQ
ncbi:MAG: 50S ribosomal protein L21 [Chloroflexota bacterium]|nr:MAG: 50S ribosomal protein L21 [Chloroflexota bacterium]